MTTEVTFVKTPATYAERYSRQKGTFKMDEVPRVGDRVQLHDGVYRVTDILWALERYTSSTVVASVEFISSGPA